MRNKIERIYQEAFEKEEFSGAVLVKVGEKLIYSGAKGYAHRGFKVENEESTMFDTASVTKLFTAVGILQLVEKGKLNLNDKIVDIVDLEGTKIPIDVEIKHLLTHTSGIADDADEEAGENYEDLFVNKPNYSIRNCRDFIPQFAYKEPNFKAGEKTRYNNCAYVLLGLAIESVTGISYQEYINENIFTKCNMKDSSFESKDSANIKVAEGYEKIEDENGGSRWIKNIYSFPPGGTADGGAYTTVHDFERFLSALSGGELLSKEMTEEIFKPQVSIKKKVKSGTIINGFGFEFFYDNEEKLICMYKEGCNAGVAAMIAYYPQMRGINIVFSNHNCNVWKLHDQVEELILEEYCK